MNTKEYSPQPIDTSDIQLSQELEQLVEQLVENVHEVWAKNRMDQEWHYGRIRDDVKKTHPYIVQYNDLPESEKGYDQNTSIETIKLILKLGFKISI